MGKDNPGVASCLLFNLFEENVEIAWVPRVRCTVVINMYQWIVLHIKLTHRLVDPAWRTSNGGLSFFLSVMWIPPYLYSCVYLRNKHSLSLSSPRWMRRHGDVLHLHVSAAATSWAEDSKRAAMRWALPPNNTLQQLTHWNPSQTWVKLF